MFDYVMAQLRAKRVPQRQVAVGSGVPFSTVTKIAQGQIKSPRVHQVQALHDYFKKVGADTTPTEQHAKAA
jgi:transcriptional regulator with XRE-family HTH domain